MVFSGKSKKFPDPGRNLHISCHTAEPYLLIPSYEAKHTNQINTNEPTKRSHQKTIRKNGIIRNSKMISNKSKETNISNGMVF